ncbi:MAG TPA: ATP-binding domain-containing protein [Polyangia bacterium]|nr:ATP-binding domain-containing protein [Polyangia bacterium]
MNRRPLEKDSAGTQVVAEERELLGRVQGLLGRHRGRRSTVPGEGRVIDYDAELIALRDSVADTKLEDMPSLVEQMTRVAALAASHQREAQLPVDPASPYFAHLRLREAAPGPGATGERVRDVLIGRRGFIERSAGVQIVDWRDAPVSQIYYRYDEGDDYDELLDARHLVGVVEARRNVSIHGGTLRRIGCPQGVFVADGEGRWFEAEGQVTPTLEGGQGKAARPPRPLGPQARDQGRAKDPGGSRDRGTEKDRGRRLGIHGGPVPRADKHLPEIAALIDREQFDLITRPSSGLVLIQGGAGSGKTTVALHRVAYLVFQEPTRFRPSRCLIVVPTVALERYVSGVLPALGVTGVPVVTARGWARVTRRRVLPHVVDRYTEDTPSAVSRIKKHPGLLGVLERYVADLGAEVGRELVAAVRSRASASRLEAAWVWFASHPLIERLRELKRWLPTSDIEAQDRQRLELALTRLRRRVRDVGAAWAEVMTDFGRLRAGLPTEGPDAVRDGELREMVRWTAAQQEETLASELEGVDPEMRAPVDGGELDDSERGQAAGRLDREDDPILLRLAQLLAGGLHSTKGNDTLIRYDHIAIDEAQDLSAIEIQVLLGTAGENRSVTLAGDRAQRLVFDNGFRGWDDLLADLHETAAQIRPLQLSYRSTAEVMRFARAVLGPLADEERPARPGAPVELHRFEAMGEAVGFLAEALRSLAGREPTASVALIARHPAQAEAYYQALARAEVPALRRVRNQEFAFAPGVDVTDVAQVKGLEFDYVVLLDVTEANYPASIEARHLLHIGATRAAHQLWLIAVGTPSPLLPEELLT